MVLRRILLLAVAVQAILLIDPVSAQPISPCTPTGALTPSTAPKGGWIGDTVASFESIYGQPKEGDESDSIDWMNEYEIEGCGMVLVSEHSGFVESINLYSPRADDDLGDRVLEDDEADWSITEAAQIARSFTPPDAQITEDLDLNAVDDLHQDGFSLMLSNSVPPEVYQWVSNDPVYGGFQVFYLRPERGSGISWITIQLQIEAV